YLGPETEPVRIWDACQFGGRQVVEMQPDHSEPFRLDQVIDRRKSILEAAAAPYPKKIIKNDVVELSGAGVETVAEIDYRANLSVLCEKRQKRQRETRLAFAYELG